jgi:hypothetical protein
MSRLQREALFLGALVGVFLIWLAIAVKLLAMAAA